ncbi:MAG: phosphatidylserine decarboxylase [Gammaproteobacteria bacterium]|nr:phosphatidylserine decarboxylase [Gammaproteobacteria bacterium]
MGWLAESEIAAIKSPFISIFCLFYRINLDEAERSRRSDYRSFNDFFTRSLKPGVRHIEGKTCSPADGTVAALGEINDNTLIQSKKHSYTVGTLLAEDTADFDGGSFITIYLAPHNYHRVHVPKTAELHRTCYLPGELFSVNQATAEQLPGLFTRNERLVCRFRTGDGPMAEVLVGAMLVAGIKPIWLDRAYKPRLEVTTEMKRIFQQGEELGQFQMGSTVILLFSQRVSFCVEEGEEVRFGQPITA